MYILIGIETNFLLGQNMTNFERDLVKSINTYFEQNGLKGISYRRKQHRYSSQIVDFQVDSPNPEHYMAVECKSISTEKGTTSLYFSQHFSDDQVERISDFIDASGRKGFLAVELKRGTGKKRKAFLMPWSNVRNKKETGGVGFKVEEIKNFTEIDRSGEEYDVENMMG